MQFGHSIITSTIANMLDKNGERSGHPLRPGHRAEGTRSRRRRPGPDSFADHPERW